MVHEPALHVRPGWRASGIGIFGGKSHAIRDNLLVNNFSGAGIRLNTVFDGHNFDLNTDGGITIAHNKLVRSGTTNDFYGNTRGAIDFQEVKGTFATSPPPTMSLFAPTLRRSAPTLASARVLCLPAASRCAITSVTTRPATLPRAKS